MENKNENKMNNSVKSFFADFFDTLKAKPVFAILIAFLSIVLTLCICLPLCLCSNPAEKLSTERNEAMVYAFENGYEIADHKKYNSPETENGRGGTALFIHGKVLDMKTIQNVKVMTISDGDSSFKEWTVMFLEKQYASSFSKGDVVNIYGYYTGFSDVTESPCIYFEKAFVNGEWIVFDNEIFLDVMKNPEIIISEAGKFTYTPSAMINKVRRIYNCDYSPKPMQVDSFTSYKDRISDYCSLDIVEENGEVVLLYLKTSAATLDDSVDIGLQLKRLCCAMFGDSEGEKIFLELASELGMSDLLPKQRSSIKNEFYFSYTASTYLEICVVTDI